MAICQQNCAEVNVQMTGLVIFKQKRKILDHEIKIKLNKKKLYTIKISNLMSRSKN